MTRKPPPRPRIPRPARAGSRRRARRPEAHGRSEGRHRRRDRPPRGTLTIDGEPFGGEVTAANLKAKLQAVRDKSVRKSVLLATDVSKPQRASAQVFEAADALGLTVTPIKPGDVAASKPKPKPESKPEPKPADAGPAVSFMKEIAPIFVQNCIACHNPRKAEGKYVMTTFDRLKKGGARSEGTTLKPGAPEESDLVESIGPDGEPRMPYKQDPLSPEKIALIGRWVQQGAKYDGQATAEDWVALLRKMTPVVIPEAYPAPVPITALAFTPKGDEILSSGYHELNDWKLADDSLARRVRPLPERVYDVAYSPDGKWLAPPRGATPRGSSARPRSAEVEADGKADARPRPRSRAPTASSRPSSSARTARPWPRPGPTVRSGSGRSAPWKEIAPRSRTTPTGCSTSPSSPDGKRLASRLTRQDQQGVRRGQEGGPGHLPRPRGHGLHRRLHGRQQAGPQRRRRRADPRLEPRRRRQGLAQPRRLRRPGLPAPGPRRRQDDGRLLGRQGRPRLRRT